MFRVVLVSTSFHEQELLEAVYAENDTGQFSFETTASFGQEAVFWTHVDVLILLVPVDPQLQKAFLDRLPTVSRKTKLIILTEQFTPLLMQASQIFQGVRLMKAPVNGYALYRALIDITTNYPVGQQQVHPRYLTDLPIQVVSDLKGLRMTARMKNLSVGGAYFEVSEELALAGPAKKLTRGDLIRLAIQMPAGKKYDFDAKLVWTRPSLADAIEGFGCAFLNKEQVYDSLLSQVGE